MASFALLLVGRAALGGAESFIVTGALTWGLGLVKERDPAQLVAWHLQDAAGTSTACDRSSRTLPARAAVRCDMTSHGRG